MAMLIVNNVGKKINETYTVQGVSFTQEPLEKIAIAGETGSGKTTLMKMIGGHEQLSEGEIQFLGRDILGPLDKLIPGHPGIAYLGQHFELRNNYFVHELLDYGNKLPAAEAAKIYEVCRINHLLNRKNTGLSGGERQRIALAKQLVMLPKLLLLDEPFSNLDTSHRNIVKQVIDDISGRLQTSCIIIAHDPLDILSWADTVLVMQQGKLIQQARPEEIYYHPVNEYCAGLFGTFNIVSSALAKNAGLTADADKAFPIIIRPEQIKVLPKTAGAINAEIKQSVFCGSYFQLTIAINKELLKVNHHSNEFKPGNVIGISFKNSRFTLLK
jgi:ABC-type sugar transport system ATPase subunit